jgi:DNA-binding HxlR family transcriptional regulator
MVSLYNKVTLKKSSRTYGQFCGLARSLDVIGDRWTLLIVRELLIGPRSYSDLQAGLPGVATNLLADRLRVLVAHGVAERRIRDEGGVGYALTEWGEGLREPVEGLIRWSTPLMARGMGDDAFNAHWLAVALRALLGDRRAKRAVDLGIDVGGTLLAVLIDEDGTQVGVDPKQVPKTVFTASPEVVLGLAAGALGPEEATALGVLEGSRRALAAITPLATP